MRLWDLTFWGEGSICVRDMVSSAPCEGDSEMVSEDHVHKATALCSSVHEAGTFYSRSEGAVQSKVYIVSDLDRSS